MREKRSLQVRGLPLLPPMCGLRARASQEDRVLTKESWFCRVPSFFHFFFFTFADFNV